MDLIVGTDSLQAPLTGVGRYAFELCKELLRHEDIERVRGFDLLRLHELEPRIDALRQADSGTAEGTGPPRRSMEILRRNASRSIWATVLYSKLVSGRLTGQVSRDFGGIFHSPNFHLPGNFPKTVVTLHDLSYLHFPQFHPEARVRWLQRMVPDALRRASRIICVSRTTQNDLLRHFEVAEEKVVQVSPGVSEAYHPRDPEALEPVLGAFGLTADRYLLCVATLEPRKNLERLLNAYVRLPAALRDRYPLVLVGARGWKSAALEQLIASNRDLGVNYLGFVSEERLPHLYAGARAFAFPSLFEGFGMPILEAQASGTPLVVSRTEALAEVSNVEALRFDPLDEAQLAAALQQALEDEAWRDRSREAGLALAAGFSWRRCASETVAVYQDVQAAAG